jgi:hypothetical protein
MSTTTWPWLPIELIDAIISEAWSSPLSAHDRSTLIASSSLVNRSWASAFHKISLEDVHIPNTLYAQQYLRIIRNDSPIYTDRSQTLSDLLCSSLSFTLDTHGSAAGQHPMFIVPFGEQDRLGTMLSNTLYTIDTLSYLPNLRRVSIEYANWGYSDLFDNFRLSSFPAQVTKLEIKFTATSGITGVPMQYHRHTGRVPWSLPFITHLTIGGACEEFIVDMVATCPNLETLEVGNTTRLAVLGSLPCNIHTVILSRPCNTARRGYIKALVGALMGGLLSTSPPGEPRIILEWGEIGKSTWMWLEEISQNCGVQLVHKLCI